MPVRMIVTDLDGTLLRTDKSISPYTLSILERCQSQGVTIVLATARSEKAAERYIALVRPVAVISNGGALLRHRGQTLYTRMLSIDITDLLIRECLSDPNIGQITVETETGFYWDSRHFNNAINYPHAISYDFSEPMDQAAYKITVEVFDKITAAALANRFDEVDMLAFAGEHWYRYAHRDATKMNAIRALADHLGIDLSQVAVFGDDYNDIGMLTGCGLGVAVSNAIPGALQAAGYVAASNDEDGVARFLDTMMVEDSV